MCGRYTLKTIEDALAEEFEWESDGTIGRTLDRRVVGVCRGA
jgi:hypothetical protein